MCVSDAVAVGVASGVVGGVPSGGVVFDPADVGGGNTAVRGAYSVVRRWLPGMPVSVAGGVVIGVFFVLTWGRMRGWTTLLLSLSPVGGMVGCFTGMLLLCTVVVRLVVLGRVTGTLCGLLSSAR